MTDTDITDEEYEEQAEQLKQRAADKREQIEQDKSALVESIKEDGGETITTKANLAGDEVYALRANTQGDWFDDMIAIQDRLEGLQTGETTAGYVRRETPKDVAGLLARLTEADEYDRDYWLGVYEETNLQALGTLMQRAAEALSDEMDRQQGAVEGFRQQSGRQNVQSRKRPTRDATQGTPEPPRE